MKLKLYVYAVTYYYGTGGEACGLRRRRCVVSVRLSLLFSISRSALGSCLLPNVTHQFFLFTLYIYLQEEHSHPTSLDAPSSLASVATRYLKSSVAFVHALYYFAWLRPLQLLTGRRRRRYPNSTFKCDFLLRNIPPFRSCWHWFSGIQLEVELGCNISEVHAMLQLIHYELFTVGL